MRRRQGGLERATRRAALLPVVLLAALAVPAEVGAQRRSGPVRVWVAGGLGEGGGIGSSRIAHNTVGIVGMGELVFQKAPHQVMARGLFIADPFSDGSSYGGGEVGVLYGRTATPRFAHASISAGLSVTGFDSCQESGPSCQFLGVPIVAEVALRPLPVLGLGAQAFGNLNRHTPYAGFALTLHLGWMP